MFLIQWINLRSENQGHPNVISALTLPSHEESVTGPALIPGKHIFKQIINFTVSQHQISLSLLHLGRLL